MHYCTRQGDLYQEISEYDSVKKGLGRPEWAFLCINYLRRPTRTLGLPPFRPEWAYLCINWHWACHLLGLNGPCSAAWEPSLLIWESEASVKRLILA
jgi:hypothetical protein